MLSDLPLATVQRRLPGLRPFFQNQCSAEAAEEHGESEVIFDGLLHQAMRCALLKTHALFRWCNTPPPSSHFRPVSSPSGNSFSALPVGLCRSNLTLRTAFTPDGPTGL